MQYRVVLSLTTVQLSFEIASTGLRNFFDSFVEPMVSIPEKGLQKPNIKILNLIL